MDNKLTGEVKLKMGGEYYTLQYTWRALAKTNAFIELAPDVDKIFDGSEPEKLAKIIAFGLEKHHPNISDEFVLDQSPVLVEAVEAVVRALNYARFGNGGGSPLEQMKKVQKNK